MSFQTIRNKLKSKLEGIDSIQEVHSYPTEAFNGFPSAVIDSTRMESEYETTNENKRTYIFTIYLFQEIEGKNYEQARRIIESVCDDVIKELDEDQLLSGIENDLPTRETMIITYPVINEIVEGEKYTRAELEIKVVISFGIS